jgi:hypothetical protein
MESIKLIVMKKKFLCLAVLFFAFTVHATVWTVSNNPETAGQFTSCQAAIGDAGVVDGDTLYLVGSLTSYGSIYLNKSLTVIGTGHHPQKEMVLKSKVTIINFSGNADGSSIIGLDISSMVDDDYGAENISIFRCYFRSSARAKIEMTTGSNNWIIKNNYINYYYAAVDVANSTNVIISSNIIGSTTSAGDPMANSNSSTVVFSNNLVLRWGEAGDGFSSVSYANISNNIFYGAPPTGATNCSFQNNIATDWDLPYDSNVGMNNLKLSDPMFVDVPLGNYDFSWDYDYRLQDASPGKNAGSDGTDIGPFGGNSPISVTGEPSMPVVEQMYLTNPILPEDGTLEIQMKARIQN